MAIPAILADQFSVYEGINDLNSIAQCDPPPIRAKTVDVEIGGMAGTIKSDMGSVEAIDFGFTFVEWDPHILGLFGKKTQLSFRAAKGSYQIDFKPVKIEVEGTIIETAPDSVQRGNVSQIKLTMNCHFYHLEIDNQTVHKIDVENGIRIIDGVDQLAGLRQALGR